MRSHRLVIATLLTAIAATAAGCGSGKDTESFMGSGAGSNTPVAAVPGKPAPVVVAGPDTEILEERDAAKAAADANLTAAEKAEKQRKAARRELREEREKAERARKRAAAREARLRKALAAKREAEAVAATPTPIDQKPQPTSGATIQGSSLVNERDARSAAEARAAVVRFHELLHNRDVRACDAITEKLAKAVFGPEEGAVERCRASVEAATAPVSVTIAEARAHNRTASVAAVSKFGDSEIPQTFGLILVDGTWIIDTVERKPAR